MRPLICHFNRDPHTWYLMGQSPAELQRLHVVVNVFLKHSRVLMRAKLARDTRSVMYICLRTPIGQVCAMLIP